MLTDFTNYVTGKGYNKAVILINSIFRIELRRFEGMKKMNKALALLLALMMVFSILPSFAENEELPAAEEIIQAVEEIAEEITQEDETPAEALPQEEAQ